MDACCCVGFSQMLTKRIIHVAKLLPVLRVA
jgi:hypothetical protein